MALNEKGTPMTDIVERLRKMVSLSDAGQSGLTLDPTAQAAATHAIEDKRKMTSPNSLDGPECKHGWSPFHPEPQAEPL